MMKPAAEPADRKPRLWQRSLVARLVFYFLLLSLVTVALLGAISFFQARRALERSVLGRLEVAAALQKDSLIQWVDDQRRELHLIAGLEPIRRAAAELLAREKTDPRFAAAYAELRAFLDPLTEAKDGWQEILVLARDSEILFSSTSRHEGDHRILDRYFVEGRKGPYVEKVYPSPITLQPTMTFSLPLGEEPAGVIALHLDLEGTSRVILEATGVGEGSESYLVDRFHVPLSSEDFGRKEFRRGVRSPGIDRALARDDGADLYRDYAGTPVLGVYRWIPEMEVALLVEIPQQAAFAPARKILWLVAAVGGGIAALLALSTFLLARQIAGPVLRLTHAAVRVARGDLGARVPVVTRDELGTLARTFNRMTETLQEEVAERIRAEKEREELIRELEARNAELERFTYTVSHDLKSPLVTIRGFLGMLVKDIESGDAGRVAADVAHIQSATDTMRRLLDELLQLSRVGRQVNPPEDVPLDDLVEEAVAMVSGAIEARGVEVAVKPGMGVARGDRVRLLEVFQNLIDNAVAFLGDQESPRVEIGARAEGDRIVCHVRDNGIGIDPQYHELVFGLFERLDVTTPGTGIGLALVKRIVELHEGRIWIVSPGRREGTTFYFTLPAAPARETQPAAPARETLPAAPAQEPPSKSS